MTNNYPDLFPNAREVIEVQPTPENRAAVVAALGPVRKDWSNAFLVGEPVYLVDGVRIAGHVPTLGAMGRVKVDADDNMVLKLAVFVLPEGNPLRALAGA